MHDSLPRCFVTFNADSMNHAHVAGKENVCINHMSGYMHTLRELTATSIGYGRCDERIDSDQARAVSSGRDGEGASSRAGRTYSSGWFWTLCSVAYSSVSLFTVSMPSP